MTAPAPRRPRWPGLFQESARPLFVLYRTRRLRFVNAAWESLTGRASTDVLGRACVRTGPTEPLFRTLAPPPEAMQRVTTVRRPVPPQKAGPPWWDITFVPVTAADGTAGFLGLIDPVPALAPVKPKSVPAAIAAIRQTHAAAFTPELFAGDTPTSERLLGQLRLAADTSVSVWIVGEPGSGKETLARVIHHTGATKGRAFVGIDCDGLPWHFIESLLFGHGGLTDSGRVGTVYLKRPTALPRDLQQRLADWFAGPGPTPRLICGSTAPAADEPLVSEFHRSLSVLELRCPPLRERFADLPRFAERLNDRIGRPAPSADVLACLAAHHWPGNFRELGDVLAAASAKAVATPVTVEHLPRYVRERALTADAMSVRERPTLDEILEQVERRLISLALRQAGGNQTEAAAKLGIFRTRLGRRIEALGIPADGTLP